VSDPQRRGVVISASAARSRESVPTGTVRDEAGAAVLASRDDARR
jgi:hypothetical protein